MIIGILIGIILSRVFDHLCEAYAMYKEIKARKQNGETMEADYINLKLHVIKKASEVKDKQVGFVCKHNRD